MSDPSKPAPESVTANIKMEIGGYKLEAQCTVPTRPVPLRLMLPMVHNIANAVVDTAIRAVEEEGKLVSCKKGCGACCRQLVPIAEIEARRLRDLVNEMPEPRRTEIRARFGDARRRFEESGLWRKMEQRDQWVEGEFNRIGLEYFFQSVPCPFLEEESCSIHPDRPISCREYLVTSPAELCAQPSAQTIEMVPIPRKVWTALARLDDMAPGAKYLRWVPLILSLDWAEENSEQPGERPGPEWLRELFNQLTEKKVPE